MRILGFILSSTHKHTIAFDSLRNWASQFVDFSIMKLIFAQLGRAAFFFFSYRINLPAFVDTSDSPFSSSFFCSSV